MFEKILDNFRSKPYFWSAIVAMTFITILTPLTRRVPEPPAVIAQLPNYTLTGPDGSPFGSEQLAGSAYVASFIFTRCQSVCPLITQFVAQLQEKVRNARMPLKLVSFTVDPEHDIPSVLKEYALKNGADPAIWTFLTGPKSALTELLEKGFTVGVGAPVIVNGLMDIAHTQKLILVDPQGRTRGFYDASSEGIDEIFARAEAVLGEAFL